MNKKDLKKFEESLASLKSENDEAIKTINSSIINLEEMETGNDSGDYSTKHDEISRLKNLKKQKELRELQIKGALKRLEIGKFGICVSCEDDITMKRLTANPLSIRCIYCQEELELDMKEKNKRQAVQPGNPFATAEAEESED